MKGLIMSLDIVKQYDIKSIDEIAKEFEEFTNQKIPKEAITQFKLSGLSSTNLMTSDFLNKYGIRNLLQLENSANLQLLYPERIELTQEWYEDEKAKNGWNTFGFSIPDGYDLDEYIKCDRFGNPIKAMFKRKEYVELEDTKQIEI